VVQFVNNLLKRKTPAEKHASCAASLRFIIIHCIPCLNIWHYFSATIVNFP